MHEGLKYCLNGEHYQLALDLAVQTNFFAPFKMGKKLGHSDFMKAGILKDELKETLLSIFIDLNIILLDSSSEDLKTKIYLLHPDVMELVAREDLSSYISMQKKDINLIKKSMMLGNHLKPKQDQMSDSREDLATDKLSSWSSIDINSGEFLRCAAEEGGEKLVKYFDFSPFDKVVDVGGNDGSFLISILKKFSKIRGITIDLPILSERVKQRVKENDLQNRLELLGTNFFTEDSFPSASLYLCGFLLHDFHQEAAEFILKKIYSALEAGGTFILHENLLDHPDSKVRSLLHIDQFSFLVRIGDHGHYRTSHEYQQWMKKIGFKWEQTFFDTPKSFMIFRK